MKDHTIEKHLDMLLEVASVLDKTMEGQGTLLDNCFGHGMNYYAVCDLLDDLEDVKHPLPGFGRTKSRFFGEAEGVTPIRKFYCTLFSDDVFTTDEALLLVPEDAEETLSTYLESKFCVLTEDERAAVKLILMDGVKPRKAARKMKMTHNHFERVFDSAISKLRKPEIARLLKYGLNGLSALERRKNCYRSSFLKKAFEKEKMA